MGSSEDSSLVNNDDDLGLVYQWLSDLLIFGFGGAKKTRLSSSSNFSIYNSADKFNLNICFNDLCQILKIEQFIGPNPNTLVKTNILVSCHISVRILV